MGSKDYYAILGVRKGATEKELKQAYRRLARRHHPDVNPGDKSAEARFKEINEAYEVLSDPEKRKKYDQFGENWKYADQFAQSQQRGGFHGGFGDGPSATHFDFRDFGSGGFNLDEILNDFFSGAKAGRAGFRSRPRRGEDIEQPMEITMEEAYRGTTRTIQTQDEEPCPSCRGTGLIGNVGCPTCGGSGILVQPRRLEVKIPAGVKEGSRVRMAGEGRNGSAGGAKGDLYLVISVKPHERFERKGDDLYVEVPISLVDAVLGGELDVPTLKGKLVLKVPPESQNGRVFRLAGQGMPHPGGPTRGSLFAKLKVVLPTNLTLKERELFEELKKNRHHDQH